MMDGEGQGWNLELRPAHPGEEELRAFVNRGRVTEGLPERSAEFWDWRAASPGGALLGSARDVAGRLRAAILIVRHPALLEGEPTHFGEVVELAGSFAAGRGLARTAPLRALLDRVARANAPSADDGMPFLFGIPTRRAHRILRVCAKAEVLRAENLLWVQPSSVEWPKTAVDVVESEGAPAQLEALFGAWAKERSAVGMRGGEHFTWRFSDHPERRYRAAVASRAGVAVGYVVLRESEVGEMGTEQGGVLTDWLTFPGDREAAMELLRWARDATGAPDPLFVNVSDRSPEFALFQSLGFRVRGTDEYLTFRGFRRPTVMSWLFANWTTTLADSERG